MAAPTLPKGGGSAGGAGRRRSRRRRRQLAEINVTPFVDVMLVLLIVFMVTAPLLTTGVTVDLPEAASAPLPGQDEPLSVTVAGDGRVFLQDSAIPLERLGARLLAITNRNPQARIFVRGDKAVDYGRVMAVVGAINGAGFAKVALVTEPPAAAPRRSTAAATTTAAAVAAPARGGAAR